MFPRNSEGFSKSALEVQANEEAIVYCPIRKLLLRKVSTTKAISATGPHILRFSLKILIFNN